MKRTLLVGAGLLVLAASVGVATLIYQNQKPDSAAQNTTVALKEFSNTSQGVKLNYPVDASVLDLTPQDVKDKFLFRASGDAEPPYSITLRYEDGLRIASQLSKTTTRQLLLDNVFKAFPTRYPGYKKLSERTFEHSGKQAAEIDFTYQGKDGSLARQALYIFLRDENTAYYLALQAKESDFDKLNSTFGEIAASFQL